jgi:hypothetical protein
VILSKVGLPKNLDTVVEGKSLLNDGVAVVLFTIFASTAFASSLGAACAAAVIDGDRFGKRRGDPNEQRSGDDLSHAGPIRKLVRDAGEFGLRKRNCGGTGDDHANGCPDKEFSNGSHRGASLSSFVKCASAMAEASCDTS